MSKVAVIYTGKYGTTENYARWICEETGADLIAGENCKVKDLAPYQCLIFGGAIHAGGILGIRFLQKNYNKLADKKIFAFAVGLNVDDLAVRQECREINFVKKIKDVPCWFFRGAYDPAKVAGMDKKLMGVVKKMIAGKSPSEMTPSEKELLDAIENGADYTDRGYIKELVDTIQMLHLDAEN